MKIKSRFADDSRVATFVIPKCMADDIDALVGKYGTKSGVMRAALAKGLHSLLGRTAKKKTETGNESPADGGIEHKEEEGNKQ